ncbi:hypothetical protein Ga0074812_14253 [Parafrankia irregularis]|uniref:PH domain-containing protein n=1 Tax=Parafrankia irregularis TaxID=795642 RepID=A0A0S4QZH7_9ACTN|nr:MULTISPECIES: hypothetical protein [Parafrankia]MBE3203638.1 hypothetical protein [Parafrankia sp. CH37]CUU60575.1 hypothetical protein Ga0074812_14253 [Parafrankia irregularis]
MSSEDVYTSVVTGWRSAFAGVVGSMCVTAVALGLAGISGPTFEAALGAIAVVSAGLAGRLATARLLISGDGVRVGAGLRGRARWIPRERIASIGTAHLSWPAVFGVGLPLSRLMTRLTVRPGPTVTLSLTSGERLWISAANPASAAALLAAFGVPSTAGGEPSIMTNRRPWFGPKRIGWGYRPVTWQGWALTLSLAVLVVALSIVLGS